MSKNGKRRGVLITGGAGFIGSNTAKMCIERGWDVFVLDNLSRPGTELNLNWLKTIGKFNFIKADIRNYGKVKEIINRKKPDFIFHFAGQTAVTTSVQNPMEDFESNLKGTLNILESMRIYSPESILIFSSTNKVYGSLAGLAIEEGETRYYLKDYPMGINETYPLDFHSPYGCSKGAADQYVHDYHRIYGLNTIVLRQSCIYGNRQLGLEDQGWVAWFMICALTNRKINIYGNGKQVRDILEISDLVRLFKMVIEEPFKVIGKIYNIGGGIENSISLLELLAKIKEITGKEISLEFKNWRPGDQKIFISDISHIKRELSWKPQININDGLKLLCNWIIENRMIFKSYIF